MSDKILKIQAAMDLSSFDQSVKKIQQELAKVNAQASQMQAQTSTAQRLEKNGYGGQMSTPAKDAYDKATQASRTVVDNKIKEQIQFQEKLSKIISSRQVALESLQKHQQGLVEGSKKELDVKQKIAALEENLYRQRASYKQRDQSLNTLLDAREKQMASSGGGAGLPPSVTSQGGASGGSNVTGLLKQIGGATAIAALITKSINTGLEVYRAYGEAPLRTSVAQGSAMSGTFGKELQNAYSGRQGIESAFLPEKAKASKMALENLENLKNYDTASIYAKILGGGAAGAIGGSAFGPAGTIAGGLGGLAAGTFGALSNPRQRARMLGEVSPTFKNEYGAMNDKQFAENLQAGTQAEKDKNPLKTMALEDYQGNMQRNLDFQRATGLNYNSFHGKGGFREQSINAGFTDSMGMGMGTSILGAGGSTRSAQENSVLGLQMQRGMGLSNAGGILGKLSGGIGGGAETKEAAIKLMSEGTRLGLDSSQFREENKKFTETAAEVIARSGSTTGQGIDNVLDRLGGFMSGKTNKDLEAGKNAYETYQSQSGATSGAGGAMRLSGMLKDQELSSMKATDRAALMQLPSEQLTADNPTVQDIASRNGMKPEDLISKMEGINRGGIHRLARADQLQTELSSFKKKSGGGPLSNNFALSQEMRDKLGEYRTLSGIETPSLSKDPREQTAYAEGSLGGSNAEARKAAGLTVEGKLANKDTGVAEDRNIQQQAESARLMLDSFQKLGPNIGQSAEALRTFNDRLEKLIDTASKLPDAQRNGLYQTVNNFLNPNNQNQAGKSSK